MVRYSRFRKSTSKVELITRISEKKCSMNTSARLGFLCGRQAITTTSTVQAIPIKRVGASFLMKMVSRMAVMSPPSKKL